MSLQHYLQKAYQSCRLSSEDDLRNIQHLDCKLHEGVENLILVYGGSFNPPHKGHLEVLFSGLRPELAATAIVVLPSEDFHLRHKLAGSHPEFFLRRQRRADLWQAMPAIPQSKVWVWCSTWYPFDSVCREVARLAAADNYQLSFSHLIGPDNVIPKSPLAILPYELPTIVISNKARDVPAHFEPDGTPKAFNGFGPWSRCLSRGAVSDGQLLSTQLRRSIVID